MAETESEVVRDLTISAQRPMLVERGKRYAWYDVENGEVRDLDLSDSTPAFKAGTVVVKDVASFAEYYRRHADDDSEVFSDLDAGTVIAVLDAHKAGEDDYAPRWQQHRLKLQLQKTLPWLTWTEQNNKPMSQQQFAEFLEDNRRDLDPEGTIKAADFLELAQSFQAQTKTEFESGSRLHSGEIELVYKETTTGTAGRTHKIEIPTEFTLAIAPFDDCQSGLINARFRYRTSPNGVVFLYVLDSPDRHVQDAVKEIVDRLSDELDSKTIMRGAPA